MVWKHLLLKTRGRGRKEGRKEAERDVFTKRNYKYLTKQINHEHV
jgi:hypothetical protein